MFNAKLSSKMERSTAKNCNKQNFYVAQVRIGFTDQCKALTEYYLPAGEIKDFLNSLLNFQTKSL